MLVSRGRLEIVQKRILTKREAAEYCGRSVREFDAECPVAPITFGNGDVRYDAHDLDVWLNSLKVRTDDAAAIVRRLGS